MGRAILKTIAELREHGKCVIYSTHIMREVEKLCDRVLILHRGHVLAEGASRMRERYRERDLEELFFQLISRHDAAWKPP